MNNLISSIASSICVTPHCDTVSLLNKFIENQSTFDYDSFSSYMCGLGLKITTEDFEKIIHDHNLVFEESTNQKTGRKEYKPSARRQVVSIDKTDPKKIIKYVIKGILDGGSLLQQGMEDGYVSLSDIFQSIQNDRCISLEERDLCPDYVREIISDQIEKLYKPKHINYVRKLFGLQPIKSNRKNHK